ncbi:unnamed protein product [Rotaria sp. Silwood1]|nr:unnamed protein product [Rotaria sp. Silwood1]CAF3611526.1 unnamed protein product [Rotaria sp. Silwood1]CAF3633855.1 unnamed protein product [Rotaria sp. Silwood1]CAF3636656.1 unnamed protein product [Rotaria sp. Silwood1]CAF4636186.1 unnamed protein product [Rotaria sp. Silwood1]
MDVDLQPLPAISYTTIGGIIDLYLFTGPTAQDVIQQYWDVIRKPAMPPYWSLGFHLCRWGYNNIDNLRTVIQRMRDAEFPYDVQWTDIDAMKSNLDFTYDPTNFNGLPDLVRSLQSEGLTVFPDFTNTSTIEWWTNIAAAFHDIIPFDGIWNDKNEPLNGVDGSIDGCTNNSLDKPPFVPNESLRFPNDNKTLGVDQQFLIGRAILVSPNLVSQTTTVHAYIPQDVWYEFPSGVKVKAVGVFTDLYAPLEKINVHVRGGFIIPMQIPGSNLMISRGNPFTLLIAQSASENATGNLFWDDGDTIGE